MKLKKSHLKELVRQTIKEDWWSMLEPDEQSAYIKAHPKSQKAQQAKKAKQHEPGDVGGPSHPNVPKKEKPKSHKARLQAIEDKLDSEEVEQTMSPGTRRILKKYLDDLKYQSDSSVFSLSLSSISCASLKQPLATAV